MHYLNSNTPRHTGITSVCFFIVCIVSNLYYNIIQYF